MSQDQSPPLEIKFPQYLYTTKVYVHSAAPAEQTLNTMLNELGPQGWELVSVTQTALPTEYWSSGLPKDQKYQTTMYFKLPWPSNAPRIPVRTQEENYANE